MTTGWTVGQVVGTCHDRVAYDHNNVPQVWLLCQTKANYSASPGDSGSPVFTFNGPNNIYIAGMHWGGSSDGRYFSPISQIQAELPWSIVF
jgi:hypothetical protein